jgi:hypothetical protein
LSANYGITIRISQIVRDYGKEYFRDLPTKEFIIVTTNLRKTKGSYALKSLQRNGNTIGSYNEQTNG